MDKVCTFLNSSGQPGRTVRGDLRLVPATWVACTGPTADGRMVTIAIFDHPGNLRYPSLKFTMAEPFAYLSTTLNWEKPITLQASAPLNLCYGVAVWDGEISPAQIEKNCHQWQSLTPKILPGRTPGSDTSAHNASTTQARSISSWNRPPIP